MVNFRFDHPHIVVAPACVTCAYDLGPDCSKLVQICPAPYGVVLLHRGDRGVLRVRGGGRLKCVTCGIELEAKGLEDEKEKVRLSENL